MKRNVPNDNVMEDGDLRPPVTKKPRPQARAMTSGEARCVISGCSNKSRDVNVTLSYKEFPKDYER